MRKAQSAVTISLGPLMTMQGDFYSIKRSGADKDEAFKRACPHSTSADVHGVAQQYSCDQHGVIGTSGDCGKMKEITTGQYVLVTKDEIDSAKASDLEKGVLALVPHRVTEVEKNTYPLGNSYVFIPSGRNQLHAVLLSIVADPDAEYVLMGEIVMSRGGTKLVKLAAWNGNLVVTELLRPEDTNAITTDTAEAEPKTVNMALQLIDKLAEPFDPETYKSRTRERVAALVEAKVNGTAVPTTSTVTAKADPTADLEALLAASLEAAS